MYTDQTPSFRQDFPISEYVSVGFISMILCGFGGWDRFVRVALWWGGLCVWPGGGLEVVGV